MINFVLESGKRVQVTHDVYLELQKYKIRVKILEAIKSANEEEKP